ncbi:molybdopterin-dependent oxidoreductase [Altererythrobacter arenosus]|uniref:Molybdopterin-dependent oxidoreductase n=1 Tax=Altererythrobacter arenosus TaxID=3032592 RepID=A0ABY8FTG7_9SPHN|nr:molybdopterin cofactor-binding domain-containing protein [Altererythrobacter sp. CAU 1644]WFL78309.1 molybdopterin-dependent oxidoreductase [Altererythrobacter sp. CAU 1644]
MDLTRRRLLTGAAIGGGVVLAWSLFPRAYPNPLQAGRDEFVFDAWLKIGSDGVVSVAVPQLEMGQGVTTLLPQIIATELGADWRQIAVEPAPVSGTYGNVPLAARWSALWDPLFPSLADDPDELLAERFARGKRFTATADGTTLAAYEMPCREAAAAARTMLAQAAADRWGVAWEECEARYGFVLHGDNRLSFAELAEEASDYDPPDPPPLRPDAPSEEGLPGEADAISAFPRLDLPSKVDGTHQFAGDVRLPNMVYAAIRHGPLDKAELVDFNPYNTRGIRGIVAAVEGNRWLAVVADNWWSAEKALDQIGARFRVEHLVDSDDITQRLDDGLRRGEAHSIAVRGDGYSSGGKADIARRYEIDPGVHATLETASATARFDGDRLELWIASQAPERAREAAAKALGLRLRDVVLFPMPAGGSFDRRLEHDHAIEVALIAREIGRPVQLVWSRWQEQVMTRPRQPAHLLLTAQISNDGQGRIEAMKARIATPPANIEFGKRLFENKTSWAAIRDSEGRADALACEGAMPAYGIGHVSVEHVPVEIGLPCSRMRGNAHGYTAFAMESFVDEVASESGREPLSYRIEMLGDDVRLVQCLQRASRLADWGGGVDQSGQGIACHRMGDSETGGRIACIASARAGEGGVRVTRLTAAVDIGRIVNIDLARQQIEGGLVFGLAMAMGASARYRAGLPVAQRLAALNLPTLADSPEIEVDFIQSEAEPFDPGELGAVVAAPAIANALFSATGLRLRRLPLLSDEGL